MATQTTALRYVLGMGVSFYGERFPGAVILKVAFAFLCDVVLDVRLEVLAAPLVEKSKEGVSRGGEAPDVGVHRVVAASMSGKVAGVDVQV